MSGVCKFCRCTDSAPCFVEGMPCAWLLQDVCDAPVCVEKAYMDARTSAEELTRLLEEGIRIEFEPGEVA